MHRFLLMSHSDEFAAEDWNAQENVATFPVAVDRQHEVGSVRPPAVLENASESTRDMVVICEPSG